MEKFTGKVWVLGDDIDTDIIIPTEYLALKTIDDMKQYGFSPLRPELAGQIQKGDIIVSQDYKAAAMALGKGVYVIHQSGKWYTNENSDHMLMERHMPPIRYYLLYFLVLFIIV